MMSTETNFDYFDWTTLVDDKFELPRIIYGGNKAVKTEKFDSRHKFSILVDAYSLPEVFKIRSLDGEHEIDRCFPMGYRPATPLEIERLLNPSCNV